MTGLIPAMKKGFDKHGALIFTVLSAFGVVGTSVVTAKLTPKAIEKIHADSKKKHGDDNAYTKMEAIKSATPVYIPAIMTGVATISCIAGAHVMSRRSQVALASAYGLVNSSYREYQTKLKELYGEEVHNNVMDAIIKDHCEDMHIITDGIASVDSLDWSTADPEIVRTFYDVYSKRYFETTIAQVLQAEYHLNRNYVLGGAESVNEFYAFLGLAPIDGGDQVGWDLCTSEIYWIDFDHRVTTLDDGMEVLSINCPWPPTPFDEEED